MIRIRKDCVAVLFVLLLSIHWEMNDFLGNYLTQIIENCGRVLAAIYSMYLYMRNKRGKRFILPVFFLALILMQVWLIFSTMINHGSLWSCFVGWFCPVVVIGLLFESMIDRPDAIIKGSMLLAELLSYVNLILIIIFPGGMYDSYKAANVWHSYRNWLLGNRNDFIPYFLFFAVIAYIYRCQGGKRWREWGVYIACLASVFLVNSSTSIVGFTVLLAMFCLIKTKRIKFNPYVLFIVPIALFLLIVVFRFQNIFSFLIVDILGKSLTFTGRTILWDKLFPLLKDNFLLGFGITKVGTLQNIVGLDYAGHAHNMILNLFYRGGIVYFGLYMVAMILAYRQLYRYRAWEEAQVISIAMFVFQIIALMEPYEKSFFAYVIYFLAYYTKHFHSQSKENKNACIVNNSLERMII